MAKPSPAAKAWLKRHRAAEKEVTRAIAKFFRGQNARILKGLGDRPSAVMVALAINQEIERAAMLAQVGPTLGNIIGRGAEFVVTTRRTPKGTKSADTEDPWRLSEFELPQPVVEAIGSVFAELESQPYWLAIQAATQENVARLVTEGLKDGLPMAAFKKRLLKQANEFSDVRAAAIARTETTLAYNAGHDVGYRFLAEEGEIDGVEWLSIIDRDTRPAHVEANGQKVPAGGSFTVAGRQTPYPGHWSLPAAQRVNCRCTTAAVFLD